MNIGIDASFFNERLTFSADYFYEHRFDIITNLSNSGKLGYPGIVGKDAPFVNSGIVDNRGIDFEIGWNGSIGDDFRYYIKPLKKLQISKTVIIIIRNFITTN